MKTSNAGFSALVDFREELLRPRFFRVREKFLCAVLLDDSAAVFALPFPCALQEAFTAQTTSIVMPSSANWRITFSTSPINSGSSADVGSSK